MARPALAALAEQQQVISHQAATIRQQGRIISAQGGRLREHEQVFDTQRDQIAALGRGLSAIAQAAGIEVHVRTAMHKRADEQNPAQPVPEPPAQPASQSTQEVKTPEAFADIMAPGLVPGSTNDVAADTTSTVYTPGDDIPGPPVKTLVDVTAPVDGTQGPRPLNEVRTLTDVRVGDPMNPQTAFPLRGGFATPPRMGSLHEASSNRTMAALRLARLQLASGTAEGDTDFEVATRIEKNASLTSAMIEHEITILENVHTASVRQQQRPAGLVPRTASQQRSVPSMQAIAGSGGAPASDDDIADADLFFSD